MIAIFAFHASNTPKSIRLAKLIHRMVKDLKAIMAEVTTIRMDLATKSQTKMKIRMMTRTKAILVTTEGTIIVQAPLKTLMKNTTIG